MTKEKERLKRAVSPRHNFSIRSFVTRMPRKATRRSILTTLKQQTVKALASLQKEIAKRETELEALRAEAARWTGVLGGQSQAPSAPSASYRARAAKRSRLDWGVVLTGLPAKFTAQEVARKSGKPMDQVYAGVGRWVRDKKVRKGKGGYRKVSAARPPRSQEKQG